MASTNTPSGFIGNLSTQQDAKLQQLWTILLKALEASGVEGSPQRKQSVSRTDSNVSGRASTASTRADSSQLAQSLQETGLDATQIRVIRQALANMDTDELHQGFLTSFKNENPDVLMLRYLRARKWDVCNAFAMMVAAVEWRVKEMQVDNVLENGELHALKQEQNTANPSEQKEGSSFLAQSRMGKCFLHGVDKIGRPIVVIRVRLHKPGEQTEEVLNRYIVNVIESVRLLLRQPVETATVVFDMTGFSLSNMEYPPVKFIIRCFEANYPECLGVLLIHNAPWIFSGIWRLIKGWMDPVIVSKIQFTKSVNDLENYIPRERIFKELGGPENWEYKYIEPEQNENKRMNDTTTREALEEERRDIVKELLTTTSSWITAAATKDNGQIKTIKARRDELAEQLSANYWKLDPYVRARNYLDRAGVIPDVGFQPQQVVKMEKELEVEQHETAPANVVNA
ncbi:CRAL-TRIO domain-containing protein [Aspergillus glaucus CBS 516.65]|uniref:CRAL-TRIO domain-containing protein n=1 Tax=Aspergillus glaucus CBS 516.65 TaxID=1160497 RepID=A0A1L9V5J3_ASPGL|nr:hypothetical protein ASPGLDRAFT_181174 [Aspergillus glaucus CBS 516.65]OJJ79193.1 hypothetical protein ASPGLDRAFT_181174 [Aspergillus glaucus CBS 516.65]